MTPTISAPIAINTFAVAGVIGLIAFTASHVLATAPAPHLSGGEVRAADVLVKEDFSGIIAWVTAEDLKITDTFGVSRTFTLNASTHILVKGLPLGSATYANLHILNHVRITALKDGSGERAETVVVQ